MTTLPRFGAPLTTEDAKEEAIEAATGARETLRLAAEAALKAEGAVWEAVYVDLEAQGGDPSLKEDAARRAVAIKVKMRRGPERLVNRLLDSTPRRFCRVW